MSDILRIFSISYFSEVSAIIRVFEDGTGFRIEATHPSDNVSINCWFHFSDESVDGDILVVEDTSLVSALAEVADTLYPGAKVIMDNMDIDDTREQFFSDFFISFCMRKYYPASPNYPDDMKHPSGRWLMEKV